MSDAERAVRLENRDRIATLIIDNPPVNALSTPVLVGLKQRLDAAYADEGVVGVVITGANDTFVAGADISRLQAIASGKLSPPGSTDATDATDAMDSTDAPPVLGDLLGLVEDGPKPTVAALDGFALGGGLELALACNARAGSPRCRVGLPELMLGLIPGAGGTQRLPRLIGVGRAVDMMLRSAQVKAEEAHRIGILDELIEPGELLDRARAMALELAGGRRELRRTLQREDRLDPLDEARRIIADARAAQACSHRNVGYPGACLDAVLEGVENGAGDGLARERRLFRDLLGSSAARGLIHVFFATRAAAKMPGVTGAGIEPQPIDRVAVLGGGTPGADIATALVMAGVEVRLKESDGRALEAGLARVRRNIERNVEKGRVSREQAGATLARISGQTDYTGFGEIDLVIETATRTVEPEQQIFRELVEHTSARAILASHTSTLGIEHIAAGTGAAERVLGLHFSSPAHGMKLMEVVRTRRTSAQALAGTLALAKRLKKTAVTVRNCPGFLVDRLIMRYEQAVGFLIDRGVDPYRIDRALYDFGMPMGPNRMSDLTGLDVSVTAGGILDAAYPEHAYRSALHELLAGAGRSGEKSGRGHYRYEDGEALEDPGLAGFVARARELAGKPEPIEASDHDHDHDHDHNDIVRMTLYGVVNEACRAIEEGVVIRPGDIDVAAIHGMGFPAYRGGPLKWADTAGAHAVYDSLASWRRRFDAPLFEPSRLLADKAESGAALLDPPGPATPSGE